MPRQLTLDLPLRPAMGRGDFFVSGSNSSAVARIEDWRHWPFAQLMLIGPEGSGKTHLAHVWSRLTGAEIVRAEGLAEEHMPRLLSAPALAIEGAEALAGDEEAETRLFHLHNALASRRAPALWTGRRPPASGG